jgi:hypothetical protein
VDCGLGGDDFGLDGLPMRPGVCAVCVACGWCGSLISSSASSRRGRVLTGRPGPFDPAGSAGVGSLFLGSRTREDCRAVHHEHGATGRYIISDQPMSEEQWIKERATVIDVAPEG